MVNLDCSEFTPAVPRLTAFSARPAGVWVAYHYDRSAVIPFASELDALRHAVDNSMQVRFVAYGEEVLAQ